MKRKGKLIISLICMLVGTVAFASCKGCSKDKPPSSDLPPEEIVQPEKTPSIKLNRKTAVLDVYESIELQVILTNLEGAVEWTTSDAAIAAVDSQGKVMAIKEGTVVITAKVGEYFATCTINVINSYAAPVLTLSCEEVRVAKDDSYTVTVEAYNNGKKLTDFIDYEWKWLEGDENIVSVSESGDSAVFTGLQLGSAKYCVSAMINDIYLVEPISITVCSPMISFDLPDMDVTVDGYSTTIATVETATHSNEIYIDLDLYKNNQLTQDAQGLVSWSSQDETIAKVVDGKIISVDSGTTYIRGEYEGNAVLIKVTVVVPVEQVVNYETTLNVDKSVAKEISLDLSGYSLSNDIKSAKVDDTEFSTITLKNNLLTLDMATLKENRIFGEKTLEVLFENKQNNKVVSYTQLNVSAKIITKIINTKADLDGFGELAKAESAKKGIWDGYFVLGQDIEYSGNYQSFMNWNTFDSIGMGSAYYAGINGGFAGTFDGCGYNINGFSVTSASSGLLGVLTTGGTFKNVSFTNAKIGAASSLICESGNGRIEDIYVQCIEQLQGWGVNKGQKSGIFYTWMAGPDALIKNCFVETNVSNASLASKTSVSPLGIGATDDESQLQNVYCVILGDYADSSYNYMGTTAVGAVRFIANSEFVMYSNNETYGAYNSYNDLLENTKFESWANEFWALNEGLPVPKNLQKGSIFINNVNMICASNSRLLLEVSGMDVSQVVYELDEDAIGKGFRMDGLCVIIPENTNGEEFTVKVSSRFNSAVYAEKTFRVFDSEQYTLSNTVAVYKNLLDDASKTFSVDLTSVATNLDNCEINTVVVNDKEFTTKTFDSNKLTLDKDSLRYVYGEKEIVAFFYKMNGDTIQGVVEIRITILAITKVIDTKADLDNLGKMAKEEERDAWYWGGYFVLGSDIQYNGVYTHFITWDDMNKHGKANAYNTGIGGGFRGTIDGRGHIIEGMNTGMASNGLVGVLETNGVVKNLIFTDAKVGVASAFICSTGDGTIENIYVQCVEQLQGWGVNRDQKSGFFFASISSENATIKNCFVETNVDDVELSSESRLSPLGIGTVSDVSKLQNVYCIVLGDYKDKTYNYLGTCTLGAGIYTGNNLFEAYQNTATYGAYASYGELLESGANFDALVNDFWMLKEGVPYPKYLDGKGNDTDDFNLVNELEGLDNMTLSHPNDFDWLVYNDGQFAGVYATNASDITVSTDVRADSTSTQSIRIAGKGYTTWYAATLNSAQWAEVQKGGKCYVWIKIEGSEGSTVSFTMSGTGGITSVQANTWTKVEVPETVLNNTKNVDGIEYKRFNFCIADSTAVFYFDDIIVEKAQ